MLLPFGDEGLHGFDRRAERAFRIQRESHLFEQLVGFDLRPDAQLVRRHARDWWRLLNRACFDAKALEEGYAAMRPSSFSRDVLQAGVQSLGVFPLKGVAWSDIGTPDRLAAMRSVAIAGAEALVA